MSVLVKRNFTICWRSLHFS